MTTKFAKYQSADRPGVTKAFAPESNGGSRRVIQWENNENAAYYVGTIGPAKFEISTGVGGRFGAMFSFAGDCYAVLSTANTVGEAKRFCEWVARGYDLDRDN